MNKEMSMEILLYVVSALTSYLIAGWNPAITFSKAVYKKDIRTMGSGNPGFTNFKRCFGNKLAWLVLFLDISKAAVVCIIFAHLFETELDLYQVGASYTGLFAVLGHAYPIWYKFKGGKGFLVSLSTVWVIDWRVGLIVTLIMVILLLTTKYMSLSTVVSLLCAPVILLFFKAPLSVVIYDALIALFVTYRHSENFKRLFKGEESKFSFGSH